VKLPEHILRAVDEQLAFQWAGWRDPMTEREERHRRESQEELRLIALDTARTGVGAYVREPLLKRGNEDRLQATYDLVDPEREPRMAGAVRNLQYVRDRVRDFGAEGLARAVVDLWRESGAPCRDVRLPERELLDRLLTGALDKRSAAVNLSAACGKLTPIEGEVLGHALGEGVRSIWKYDNPVYDFFEDHDEAHDEQELLALFQVAASKCGLEWKRVDDFPPESEDEPAGHVYTSRGCEPKNQNRKRLYGAEAPDYVYYESEDGTWQRTDTHKFVDHTIASELDRYLGRDWAETFSEDFWKRPQTLYVVVPEEQLDAALLRGLYSPEATEDEDHAEYLAHEFDRKVLRVDTRAMKADGTTLHVRRDDRTVEYASKSELAWKLGVEEWPGESDESTIYIDGHAPAKYVSAVEE
jgi:hypothetical protein